jgi:D-alanyl-D-alanine carboxypeptidase
MSNSKTSITPKQVTTVPILGGSNVRETRSPISNLNAALVPPPKIVAQLPPQTDQGHLAAVTPETSARTREGWIIQVGSFDAESDAQRRLLGARAKVGDVLEKADPFTEPVIKGEKTLYRARFAGFRDKDDAEEACRQLKLKDIDCMTVRN